MRNGTIIKSTRSLILEDNPARFPFLINKMSMICYPYIDLLIIATTAEEAMNELKRHRLWNVIMLDHDLDGRTYVDSDERNTGYQVAKFIRENKIEFGLCIIHSLNQNGSKRILNLLKDYGKVIYSPCVDTEVGYENNMDEDKLKDMLYGKD